LVADRIELATLGLRTEVSNRNTATGTVDRIVTEIFGGISEPRTRFRGEAEEGFKSIKILLESDIKVDRGQISSKQNGASHLVVGGGHIQCFDLDLGKEEKNRRN